MTKTEEELNQRLAKWIKIREQVCCFWWISWRLGKLSKQLQELADRLKKVGK